MVTTSVMAMCIDHKRVECVVFAPLPLSLDELMQQLGRGARTLDYGAGHFLFDVAFLSECLSVIGSDALGLANFTLVLQFLVQSEYCKRSLLQFHYGELEAPHLLQQRDSCCSSCDAFADGWVWRRYDATDDVLALCAFVEATQATALGVWPAMTALTRPRRGGAAPLWSPTGLDIIARKWLVISIIAADAHSSSSRVLKFASQLGPDARRGVQIAVGDDFEAAIHEKRRFCINFPEGCSVPPSWRDA